MATRKYPYNAFIVTASMNIKPVKLVGVHSGWMATNYDKSEAGPVYCVDDLYRKKEAAIAAAETKMLEQEARLEKQKLAVAKRRANLTKAKGA